MVAALVMNGVEDAGVLEGLRPAGVNLGSLRQALQHRLARLVAVVVDDHLDIALPYPLGDSLDGLFGCRAREVFLRLAHLWNPFRSTTRVGVNDQVSSCLASWP